MRSVAAGALLAAIAWIAAPPALAQSGYVGDEACLTCHEDVMEDYRHTIHAKVLTENNALSDLQQRGCESCHGPGQAHVEAGGGAGVGGEDWITFAETGPEAVERQNAACLECHSGGSQRFWHASPHSVRNLSCGSCHQVMKKISDEHLLTAETQTAQCSECHLLPRSQMYKTSHMPTRQAPFREGWMDCGDCHNPHGTIAPKLIQAHSINQNCYSCHADKRGPFLWEHAPVTEDCTNCHHPHGSINQAMLKVAQPRLCQTCHIESLHPSEARLPGNRFVIGQSCSNCHLKVHGSNHPSGIALTR